MVARGRGGELIAYPLVETVQRDHICHEVVGPASGYPREVERAAREAATAAVDAVGAVGVVGVELFWLADGTVMVNELAPRPHNSGITPSKAVQPRSSRTPCAPYWAAPGPGQSDRARRGDGQPARHSRRTGRAAGHGAAAQAVMPGSTCTGRRQSRPGRKMGHVTALGATPANALASARQAAATDRMVTAGTKLEVT